MTNGAFQGIGILEVIPYSSDWVVQRHTQIGSVPYAYERCYHSGSTWGNWKKVTHATYSLSGTTLTITT